jgi:citrate lyase subunit beta/citryl-CoA lyase
MIMLAKTEICAQLADLGREWQVVALCETPLGVVNAAEIAAAPNVVALMWGAEDLVAAMGGRGSRWPDGRYRDVALHARSTVLLAAAAHGKPAVDAVYVDIPDLDGLATEAEDAVASGFAYKACIHPSQAAVVRQAFRPDEAQLAWARRVLAAVRDASGQDKGVLKVDGQMIDAPLIRQAETILASDR